MARCGCNTAMSTTCDAIMSCIAGNLGRGLDYNEATGQIELRISTDAGNTAQIGTDDGLYAPSTPGPGPMVWPATVATLPAQAISANGGSNLVGPSTAPELVEYSIANGIDIYSTSTFGVADGTMYEAISSINGSVTTYTDNPGGITNRYISSLTMQQLNYDAGTRVNPTGRNSNAPTPLLTPDGGWGGFYAPQYKPRTIDEMFRQVRGRIVVDLLVQRLGIAAEQIEADIRATVEAVVEAGAQEWCIIEFSAMLDDNTRAPINDWVPIITDAGIAAGINTTNEFLMASPFTGAEIVASGATWVTVVSQSRPNGVSDARITELVGAGLEVIVQTSARQYWTDHAFGLGARVVRAPDAVYARGSRGEPGDLDYRQHLIPGLATRTTAIGALTPVTDTETAMWHPGFARADLPGRWFPVQYAWVDGTRVVYNHQLLGTICPIPNTTDYRITIRVRRETSLDAAGHSAALFFAAADDRDISYLSGSSSNPVTSGYQAELRANTTGTTMALARVDAGSSTSLGTVAGVNWTANEWCELEVTVQGADLTFTATSPTATNTINAVDTTYRGAYAFHVWSDQAGPFVHGYDNPTDLVMYEALS